MKYLLHVLIFLFVSILFFIQYGWDLTFEQGVLLIVLVNTMYLTIINRD